MIFRVFIFIIFSYSVLGQFNWKFGLNASAKDPNSWDVSGASGYPGKTDPVVFRQNVFGQNFEIYTVQFDQIGDYTPEDPYFSKNYYEWLQMTLQAQLEVNFLFTEASGGLRTRVKSGSESDVNLNMIVNTNAATPVAFSDEGSDGMDPIRFPAWYNVYVDSGSFNFLIQPPEREMKVISLGSDVERALPGLKIYIDKPVNLDVNEIFFNPGSSPGTLDISLIHGPVAANNVIDNWVFTIKERMVVNRNAQTRIYPSTNKWFAVHVVFEGTLDVLQGMFQVSRTWSATIEGTTTIASGARFIMGGLTSEDTVNPIGTITGTVTSDSGGEFVLQDFYELVLSDTGSISTSLLELNGNTEIRLSGAVTSPKVTFARSQGPLVSNLYVQGTVNLNDVTINTIEVYIREGTVIATSFEGTGGGSVRIGRGAQFVLRAPNPTALDVYVEEGGILVLETPNVSNIQGEGEVKLVTGMFDVNPSVFDTSLTLNVAGGQLTLPDSVMPPNKVKWSSGIFVVQQTVTLAEVEVVDDGTETEVQLEVAELQITNLVFTAGTFKLETGAIKILDSISWNGGGASISSGAVLESLGSLEANGTISLTGEGTFKAPNAVITSGTNGDIGCQFEGNLEVIGGGLTLSGVFDVNAQLKGGSLTIHDFQTGSALRNITLENPSSRLAFTQSQRKRDVEDREEEKTSWFSFFSERELEQVINPTIENFRWTDGSIATGSQEVQIRDFAINGRTGNKVLTGTIAIIENFVFEEPTVGTRISSGATNATMILRTPVVMEGENARFNFDSSFTLRNEDVLMIRDSTNVIIGAQFVQGSNGNTKMILSNMTSNVIVNQGRLEMTGSITSTTGFTNRGTLFIGLVDSNPPPGRTLNLQGTFSQTIDGITVIKIGGVSPQDSDSFKIDGTANIDGDLNITIPDSVQLNATTAPRIFVVEAGTVNGRFNLVKDPNVLVLEKAALSYEPSSQSSTVISRVTLVFGGCPTLGDCSLCLKSAEDDCIWCRSGFPACIDASRVCEVFTEDPDKCLKSDDFPIAAIIVPILVILIIAAIIIFLLWRRKRKTTVSSDKDLLKRKPPPPDFVPIAFGKGLIDSRVSKKEVDRIELLQDLKRLLVDKDLVLANAITSITKSTEQDKIANALVYVFESAEGCIPLLKSFITNEVKAASSSTTLFRSNSMASKMLKFYSKLTGLQYLYDTISDIVFLLIEKTKTGDINPEVDAVLLEEGEDDLTLKVNKYQLLLTAQQMLTSILRSIKSVPIEFRVLCHHLKHEVTPKFPESKYTSVGGFIFLRFFNPAINLPESYGLSREPPSKEARRVFVLITKTLQSLANGIKLGGKEEHMSKLNDFIDENQESINRFFDELASLPSGFNENDDDFIPTDIPPHIEALSLASIYNQIYMNIQKIKQALADHDELNNKLDKLIADIGEPFEIDKAKD